MCGINGSISWNHYQTNIHEMNNQIIHRGPDSEGIYTDEKHEVKVQMGMRRLSIIDLHDGQQPISTENEQVSIVFNGEIYNYLAIKEMLIDEGAIFKTKSDTEVILQLYYKIKDELLYLSEVSYLNKQGIFNTHYIQNIIHEHISSKKDHTFKIWTFIVSKNGMKIFTKI